ncbi:MAG: amidohydrolase family protein [Dehalococcoidia bacterium]
MAKKGFKVLDSDLHVMEPGDLYTTYMDPKWGDRIPRTKEGANSFFAFYTTADGKTVRRTQTTDFPPLGDREAPRFKVGLDRDFDPVSQLKAMDMEGIDVAVLFRTLPLYTDDAHEPEYAMDLCKAWNDWITDFCNEDSTRMKGAGLISLHDAGLAVNETRRIVTELGHVGVCLTPEPALGRQLPEHYFDPVWAEAQDLNVPICFHPSFSPNQVHWSNRFAGLSGLTWLVETFDQPMEDILAVVYMTAGGIMERFPNLKVAFLEGNCSWLPWLLYRLDERYELYEGLDGVIELSLKPSEYFFRQGFISVDVDEYLVADFIARYGDDHLVFTTDYPHADCKFPNATSMFLSMEGVSQESKRKILWDNCARLYNL